MKCVLFVIAGLMMLVNSAGAAIVEFRGAVCLKTITPACASEGYSVGTCLWVRYLPPGLGDNGASTRITIIDYGGAENYRLATGSLVGNTLKTVTLTGVYRNGFQVTAKMRITKQSPADLTASESVVMTGNITDFDGTPGCDVQFKGAGTRQEY